ncbi:MAG: hypothetical protein FWE20_09935 [Defluviitaleaceae bacterium]|nr:hypothetical protein [Defluviitaleaceae bacterium]
MTLKTDYKDLQDFEKIYISKVFTKTICDDSVLCLPNVQYGGTGFFNENAPGLLYEFEHAFPDYALYNGYVSAQIEKGTKPSALKCFVDYSTELSLDIV